MMNCVGCWRCHLVNNWTHHQVKQGYFRIWLCYSMGAPHWSADLHKEADTHRAWALLFYGPPHCGAPVWRQNCWVRNKREMSVRGTRRWKTKAKKGECSRILCMSASWGTADRRQTESDAGKIVLARCKWALVIHNGQCWWLSGILHWRQRKGTLGETETELLHE